MANEIEDHLKNWLDEFRQQTKNTIGALRKEQEKYENRRGWQQTYKDYDRAVEGYEEKLKFAESNLDKQIKNVTDYGLGIEHMPIIKQVLSGDRVASQGLDELLLAKSQAKKQGEQLGEFRGRAEEQIFGKRGGTLAEALGSPAGELGQLSDILRQQQSDVFQKELSPMLRESLAPQGLYDSGANIELQSKSLAGLERNRQNTLLQAALGSREQMRGLERTDILGDIGAQQQAISNMADIQRSGLTMQFQRELEAERNNLARELAGRQGGGGSSTLMKVLGGIGTAGAIAAAPFTGGMSLAAMPAFLGMAMGPQGQAGGTGAAMLGQSFFGGQGQSFFPRTQPAGGGYGGGSFLGGASRPPGPWGQQYGGYSFFQ